MGPPRLTMKFLRVGEPNKEKPAIIDSQGTIRDLSPIIEDLNQALTSSGKPSLKAVC